MEAAGLVVGVAGLAGLFSCCSNAFQLVQRGRAFGKDYKIIETKFGNQELRLRAWGRACGLIDETQYDPRLDEPELYQQLKDTLECIKELLGDAKALKDRYGLAPCQEPTTEADRNSLPVRTLSLGAAEVNRLGRRRSLNRFRSLRSKLQQHSSSSKIATARWIIEDRDKFSELVQHLKDFIDDLEALTRATEISRRQLIFVEYEVESIHDAEVLEEMEIARQGDGDVVSDAASARLEEISQGTASVRTSMVSDSNRSSLTLESYVTARTHFSLSRTSSIALSEATRARHIGRTLETLEENNSSGNDRRQIVSPRNPDFGILRSPGAKPVYKCVFVGEPSARKTELVCAFVLGYLPEHHTPLILKETTCDVQLHGHQMRLSLWDTSGLEDYENLRKVIYKSTDVVGITYLLGTQNLEAVRTKWAQEIHLLGLADRCFLVGVEPELNYRSSPVDFIEGKNLAKDIGAQSYVQCNVQSRTNVNDVFEAATRIALRANNQSYLPSRATRWKLPWRSEGQGLPVVNESRDEAT